MKEKKIPRLIYTDTDINVPVLIESFNYGRKDGTQDIYFTLKFKEYRKIEVPEIGQSNSTQNNQRPTTDKNTNTQQTHTVKKGDNLWDISQKYLGKGSLYNITIESKNKIKMCKYLNQDARFELVVTLGGKWYNLEDKLQKKEYMQIQKQNKINKKKRGKK